MHIFSQIALLGPIFALAVNGATIPQSGGSSITQPFHLDAVDLSTGTVVTALAVRESLASRHILGTYKISTRGSDKISPAAAFTYNATAHRLQNTASGASDPVLANRTLTFGEFETATDGRIAAVTAKKGAATTTYFVFEGTDASAADGWSLCADDFAGVYWSGAQKALPNCSKVALTPR